LCGTTNLAKEKKPSHAVQALLPLATAARLIYARATGHHTEDIAALNGLARLIAAHTRIYTVKIDETARLLPVEILADGDFEEGGALFRFKDPKRAPIGALAIRRTDLGNAMDEIRKLYGRSQG
jgi:hypothetical protein